LVELTHFHLFTEPVALLVVAHLYNLGGDEKRRKQAAIIGTTVAMAVQIGLPWVVLYVSPAAGVAMFPATILLLLGFFYMTGMAAWDMWGPERKA
jgi:hypothetical protein